MTHTYDLLIIGGGPAGIMAAIAAKQNNTKLKAVIVEKNNSLGEKLLLTGKGRCNLTNVLTTREIVEKFGVGGKFMHGPLSRFSNQDLIEFFHSRKIETTVEKEGKVFPKNGGAQDVLNCLKKELTKLRVTQKLNWEVVSIERNKEIIHVRNTSNKVMTAKKLVIATGGKSYPQTGSTGDGYRFARELGHSVNSPQPALAPLIVKDTDIRELAGLSLSNTKLTIKSNKKEYLSLMGDVLFTHKGVSGPIVLNISNSVYNLSPSRNEVTAHIDLLPTFTKEVLKKKLYKDIHQNSKKEYSTMLAWLLPKSLVSLAVRKTGIAHHSKIGRLEPTQVNKIVSFLKDFNFVIDAAAPIESGIVTQGGVATNQIDSTSMKSKINPNILFAGEIINLHGPTGGFNLQQAFSTGYLAGKSAM